MWVTGTGSDVWKRIAAPMVGGIFEAARERTYKALHEKAMGGPHAEQVNPELVNSLGQKLGAREKVA